MKTTEVGPVPALVVSFLQQAVASSNTVVRPLSACLPEDLVRRGFFQSALGLTISVLILVLHLPS